MEIKMKENAGVSSSRINFLIYSANTRNFQKKEQLMDRNLPYFYALYCNELKKHVTKNAYLKLFLVQEDLKELF